MSKFPDEVWELVLERLAQGKSLRSACKGEGMPRHHTVLFRATHDHEFAERYADARRVGYLILADEILDISDDGTNDYTEDERGRKVVDKDHIIRSRLRVDSRKWLVGKCMPKIFGDRVSLEASGPDGAPLQIEVTRRIVRPNES
jgi:hypothetical protein